MLDLEEQARNLIPSLVLVNPDTLKEQSKKPPKKNKPKPKRRQHLASTVDQSLDHLSLPGVELRHSCDGQAHSMLGVYKHYMEQQGSQQTYHDMCRVKLPEIRNSS
jgi:hypothetical protein